MFNYLNNVRDYHGYRTLNDCYAKPSTAKKEIWKDIQSRAVELNGIPFIVGYNCFMFSAAIQYTDNDGLVAFEYITKTKTIQVTQ